MTPTEDFKHDIAILVELVECLLVVSSTQDKEYEVRHAYANLRHKFSQKEVQK